MKASFRSLLISAALLAGSAAMAADTAPTAPDKFSNARARIAEKNWQAAIGELRTLDDTGSAEWNNLMGFSMR